MKTKPDYKFNDIYTIDYIQLKEMGIDTLLIDLNNTLISYEESNVSDRLRNFFITIKSMGFRVVIVSNNLESRVKPISEELEVEYLSKAKKPNIERTLKKLTLNPLTSAVIGDSSITDVKYAENLKSLSVLINPINSTNVPLKSKINSVVQYVFNII